MENENLSPTNDMLLNALAWLADAADEDCPAHCRTDDFNEALANALELLDAALAVGVAK